MLLSIHNISALRHEKNVKSQSHFPNIYQGTSGNTSPPKTEGIKFQSRGARNDGKECGDDASNRNAFQYKHADKSEGSRTVESRNYSHPPCSTSRMVRGIYSCVDSGKLWSIKKQISNSVETARYKHYSACNGILTANPLTFCFLEHPRMFRAASSL